MTCKRYPLVSPQFANEEEEEEEDDGTIESGNAACAWIQPNGVYTYTQHGQSFRNLTSAVWLQCWEKNKNLTIVLALPLLHETV